MIMKLNHMVHQKHLCIEIGGNSIMKFLFLNLSQETLKLLKVYIIY